METEFHLNNKVVLLFESSKKALGLLLHLPKFMCGWRTAAVVGIARQICDWKCFSEEFSVQARTTPAFSITSYLCVAILLSPLLFRSVRIINGP